MSKTPSRAKSKTSAKAPVVVDHAPPAPPASQAPGGAVLGSQSGSTTQPHGLAKTIYCTIAAAHDLPQALQLRDSLVAAHGPVDFRLLLLEHPAVVARLRAQLPDVQVLAPDELGCAPWLQLAFYYDQKEYAAALRPALMRTLLAEGNVIYLAPQVEVLAPLGELETALHDAELMLIPAERLPADGSAAPSPPRRHRSPFNLGFVAVAQGAAAAALLSAWEDSLVAGAADADGQVTDQLAAAAVAAAATRLKLWRSAQYNLAASTARLGDLQWDGAGQPQTQDGPLVLFHHSGVTGSSPAAATAGDAPLAKLGARYQNQLAKSPYQQFAQLPYSFDSYATGAPITPAHRRAQAALPDASQRRDNPFAQEPRSAPPAPQSTPVPCPRCVQLEERLNHFPHSLVGYVGRALDLLVPGSRDRLYNYAGRALHRVVPSRPAAH